LALTRSKWAGLFFLEHFFTSGFLSLSRVVKTMDVDIRRENEQQQMSETISWRRCREGKSVDGKKVIRLGGGYLPGRSVHFRISSTPYSHQGEKIVTRREKTDQITYIMPCLFSQERKRLCEKWEEFRFFFRFEYPSENLHKFRNDFLIALKWSQSFLF
jgi:hypothetical protein